MPEIFNIDTKIKQKRVIITDSEKGHREKAEITLKNEEATIVITVHARAQEPFIQGQTVTVKISQVQTQLSQDDDKAEIELGSESTDEDKDLEGENPFGEDEHIPEEDLENA